MDLGEIEVAQPYREFLDAISNEVDIFIVGGYLSQED